MSGYLFLDWAALAVSFTNTILLVWLSLTILFNAERRTWGVWLAGGGLLVGAAFFVSHSAILGQKPAITGEGLDFWWHFGWAPAVLAPSSWYFLMLWYTGFWNEPVSRLRRHQLPGLIFVLVWTVLLFFLLSFANPLPFFTRTARFEVVNLAHIGNVPLLIIAYPAYILVCLALALYALLHPWPSTRFHGEIARQRARPWLVATTLLLMMVSLLVGSSMVWVALFASRQPLLVEIFSQLSTAITWLDLLIDLLIMLAILLLGQAVISYEIFTGRTLPRRGFSRQWRDAIVQAGGVSVVVAGGLTLQLQPVYTILLTLVWMAFFYALFNWQVFLEREQSMRQLRPFVTSQRLYDRLLSAGPAEQAKASLADPFQAVCREILNTTRATLLPAGTMAALAGAPLEYPPNAPPVYLDLTGILNRTISPSELAIEVQPPILGTHTWAVPLWSERGLIGLLLLGDKVDGSFYSQEEIEIARNSGERFIDMLASAGLAQRLIELQRQRLAETQVLDQMPRRILHDDVLPRLHTALLSLGSLPPPHPDAITQAETALASIHRQLASLLHDLPAAVAPDVERLGLLPALKQVVSLEMASFFDDIHWEQTTAATTGTSSMPVLEAGVIFYAAREAVRNAARHARYSDRHTSLKLKVNISWEDGLVLLVEDNGRGFDVSRLASAANGHGLALHSTLMAVIGGSLEVDSLCSNYTRVTLRLPVHHP